MKNSLSCLQGQGEKQTGAEQPCPLPSEAGTVTAYTHKAASPTEGWETPEMHGLLGKSRSPRDEQLRGAPKGAKEKVCAPSAKKRANCVRQLCSGRGGIMGRQWPVSIRVVA